MEINNAVGVSCCAVVFRALLIIEDTGLFHVASGLLLLLLSLFFYLFYNTQTPNNDTPKDK